MLSRTNLLLLSDLLGDRLVQIRPPRTASRPRDAWRGYVDGVDDAFLGTLCRTVEEQQIGQMFIDGSNYGAAAAAVKRHAPQVRIMTFFHNVEARFFWGAMRTRRTIKSAAVLAANYVAERKAVRASDVLVTLSERDSEGLRRLYGRAADAVAPMVMEDKAAQRAAVVPPPHPNPYLLFVGGGFYANIAGIRWFARTVAPRADIDVCVVGRDMEELADEFSLAPRMRLVGAVDDLAPWYAGATLVIAPIFDGSGMKTKVAEALMFGKSVAGTPEAFSGYADDVVAANQCCADAAAFISALDAAAAIQPGWDAGMRALYERDHSPAAARARLARIIGVVDQASVS